MRIGREVVAAVVCMGLVSFFGCAKKTEVEQSGGEVQKVQPAPATAADQAGEDAARAKAAREAKEKERAASAASGMQPIYFDFDQSTVRDDAKSVLRTNIEWLRAHPEASVRIEGNCDERGTIEYNQALGQRRSQSAKKFFVNGGIAPARISMVSYGKEKPVCQEATEDCWQKNRRADFVVVAK